MDFLTFKLFSYPNIMSWLTDNEQMHRIDIEKEFYVYVPIEDRKYPNLFSTRGKILFNQKDFSGALNAYSMAIVFSYDDSFLAKMLSNRAMVYIKLTE